MGRVRYRPINLHYNAYIITGGEGTHCESTCLYSVICRERDDRMSIDEVVSINLRLL